MAMKTEFAPAERLSPGDVEDQSRAICCLPFVRDFLDAVPNMALVLNECRQIVFANRTFRDFVGIDTLQELVGCRQGEVLECIHAKYIGQRPGEAVGCIRSGLTEGGCGTTLFCRTCGAVRAILNSQQMNRLDIQECQMIRGEEEDPLDLRVWSRPLEVNGNRYTVFSVMDISDEKRRKALERIFFSRCAQYRRRRQRAGGSADRGRAFAGGDEGYFQHDFRIIRSFDRGNQRATDAFSCGNR